MKLIKTMKLRMNLHEGLKNMRVEMEFPDELFDEIFESLRTMVSKRASTDTVGILVGQCIDDENFEN